MAASFRKKMAVMYCSDSDILEQNMWIERFVPEGSKCSPWRDRNVRPSQAVFLLATDVLVFSLLLLVHSIPGGLLQQNIGVERFVPEG